jgi:hypothetical protein
MSIFIKKLIELGKYQRDSIKDCKLAGRKKIKIKKFVEKSIIYNIGLGKEEKILINTKFDIYPRSKKFKCIKKELDMRSYSLVQIYINRKTKTDKKIEFEK